MRKGQNLESQGNLLIRVKIYKDICLSFSDVEIYYMQDPLDISL